MTAQENKIQFNKADFAVQGEERFLPLQPPPPGAAKRWLQFALRRPEPEGGGGSGRPINDGVRMPAFGGTRATPFEQ